MTLKHLYTRYVNEYNEWAKAANARITAELYEDNFTVRVKKPGKLIPMIKVHAKHDGDQIKITHSEGLSKTVTHIERTS